MSGSGDQKKRFWSDEEKRLICGQARMDGASVARVARRYLLNANVLHKWLRDPRYASEAATSEVSDAGACNFLPIEIEGRVLSPPRDLSSLSVFDDVEDEADEVLSAQRVDVTLSDGRRILIEGTTALSTVVALVEGLVP
jgi:transposase